MKALRMLRYKYGGRFRHQTCANCGRFGDSAVWFYVPDQVWAAVMGDCQDVLCLTCFDRRAELRRVDYSQAIRVQGRRSWLAGLPSYQATAVSSDSRARESACESRASITRSA